MTADNLANPYNRLHGRVLTIDDLPDGVLLEIFGFYVVRIQDLGLHGFRYYGAKRKIESWQSLVHVCRRWRGLVFGSPRRLNLRLYYEPRRRATKTLDIWPPLPLFIHGDVSGTSVDNVIAELEHSDRIYIISLNCYGTEQVEKLWTTMQVPLPELTYLRLSLNSWEHMPVLPDSFLGGSAPHLRYLYLDGIPSPGLPNLLFSAIHLVELRLYNIPHSTYISPEAMATCLPMLTSLETFFLQFESPQSSLEHQNRRPPPPTRSILPALTCIWFNGANEYLEELVARIDTPQLAWFSTELFLNGIDFNTPELTQFIGRTPTLGEYDWAYLFFESDGAQVALRELHSRDRTVEVRIFSPEPDRQLSTMAQICTLSLSRNLSAMENLQIYGSYSSPLVQDQQSPTEWLDLLLPFTAVENLHIDSLFLPTFALALKRLTAEGTTEVLPALKSIFLDPSIASEPVEEGIVQFISARRLTNQPVTISTWE